MRIVCAALCALLLVGTAWAQEAEPVRIVAEAEHFAPADGAAWQVMRFGENYFHGAIGASYISRERLLSAPEQCAPSRATKTVQVPEAGEYRVWAHYESPHMYNTCFRLEISQGGKRVFQGDYGSIEAPKQWPFGQPWMPQFNPGYGGGDNIAWEGHDPTVNLQAGEATLALLTLDNPQPAAKRNVDVIFLTTDTSPDLGRKNNYPLLNELREAGRFFLRVRSAQESAGAAQLQVSYHYNRRPWYGGSCYLGPSGTLPGRPTETDALQPGTTSAWADISAWLDTVHQSQVYLQGKGTGLKLAVEAATQPDEAHIVCTLPLEGDDPWNALIVPVDFNPAETLSYLAISRRQVEYVKQFPMKGRLPKRILFYGSVGRAKADGTPLEQSQFELAKALGYNTLRAEGQPPRSYFAMAYGVGESDEKVEKLRGSLSESGMLPHLLGLKIGDEVHLSQYIPEDGRSQRFREYLEAEGFKPADVKAKSWEEADLAGWEAAAGNPVLYYESAEFLARYGIEGLKTRTARIRKHLGDDILIGANFSPHPYFWPHQRQWIDVFKSGAASISWSEDYHWQVAIASPQLIGWLLDAMRCGAKYHDSLIHFYVMPHSPGNTDLNFRLGTYIALGHGARHIDHFSIGPQHYWTENYVDWRDVSRYQQIHDTIREVGTVDDLLFDGRVKQAEAAVLLSNTTDLWDLSHGPDTYNIVDDNPNMNVYNTERQCAWLALRHAQSPVDLVTEDDLIDGRLKDYRMLYVAGDHLQRKAAAALAGWVKEGGVVLACAGGGFLDEYNRPLDTLAPVFGVAKQTLTKRDLHVRGKMELPRLKPLDQVSFAQAQGLAPFAMEALAFKQALTPRQSAKVIGTFADGSAAAVLNRYGEGAAILVGTLPGLAYVKQAIPVRPYDRGEFAHFLPQDYSAEVRSLFEMALRLGGASKAVVCSEPLVDATAIASEHGVVVPLANYTGEPIERLSVTLRGLGEITGVRSMQQGDLALRREGDAVICDLPMGLTDFLVVSRK